MKLHKCKNLNQLATMSVYIIKYLIKHNSDSDYQVSWLHLKKLSGIQGGRKSLRGG